MAPRKPSPGAAINALKKAHNNTGKKLTSAAKACKIKNTRTKRKATGEPRKPRTKKVPAALAADLAAPSADFGNKLSPAEVAAVAPKRKRVAKEKGDVVPVISIEAAKNPPKKGKAAVKSVEPAAVKPVKAKRAASAFALAVGEFRKQGMSFKDAVASAKGIHDLA